MDRACGLERLHAQRVNHFKSLKPVFFGKHVNGAYRLYGVGENRLAMFTLLDKVIAE